MKPTTAVELLITARWRFASTMPQWPHIYTLRAWWSEDQSFTDTCALIEQRGQVLPWPKPPATPRYHNSYLVLSPFKFWAMGPRGDQDDQGGRTVINCAIADPDELAYDDAASVNQIGAWSDLVERLSELLHPSSSRGRPTTS